MYKIYFEDRLIKISSKLSFKNIKTNSIYFCCKNKKSFYKFVKVFRKNNEIKFLFINTKKENKIFKQLKSKFKTINAAGGLVFNNKSQILIIKRDGKWDLPKGKVEKNEKIKTAAIREVEEECGVSNLEIIKKITKTYHSYNFRNKDVFKTTYWYLMNYKGNEILKPQTEEGITEVKWLDINKLNEVLSNTHTSLVEVFEFAKKIDTKILL